MFAAIAGFSAGLIHVFSGPDHLAAVAPFAADQDRGQWRAGFRWGLGHTIGVLLIGLLLVTIGTVLPIQAVSAYSERLVGLMLIAVAIWAFRRARSPHSHHHADAGASFGVGVLHGVAGSSHLFGLLPGLALPSPGDQLLYLGAYGAAVIVGMTAYACLVGLLAMSTAFRSVTGYRGLLYACSLSALLVGGFWLAG